MAESRPLPTNFWSWPTVADLLLDQKAIAAYLWTNRFTNSAGCYVLPPRLAAAELGIKESVFREAIRQFKGLGLVDIDQETEEVLVLRWFAFHKFTTGPQLANFWRARDQIRSTRLQSLVVKISSAAGVQQCQKRQESKKVSNLDVNLNHNTNLNKRREVEAVAAAEVAKIQAQAPRLRAGTPLVHSR